MVLSTERFCHDGSIGSGVHSWSLDLRSGMYPLEQSFGVGCSVHRLGDIQTPKEERKACLTIQQEM